MTFDLSPFLASDKHVLFGLTSAMLSIVAFIPYIIDTFAKRTKPDRACWLIWSVLSMISFSSLVYEGALASLWFVGAQMAGTSFICLLSIWFGAGSYFSRKNLVLFSIAALGLVSWYMTDTALYALLISIGISLLGGTVTVIKSYVSPESETLSTWIISLLAAICAAASVAEPTLVLMAYPMYLLVLYVAIVLATLTARGRFETPNPAAIKVRSLGFDQAI